MNDRSIIYEEAFSEAGLLPAMAKRADQLCSLCLNYGIGVTFHEEENSMLKTKAVFDDSTPNVIRLMCLIDVLCELVFLGPSRDVTPLMNYFMTSAFSLTDVK